MFSYYNQISVLMLLLHYLQVEISGNKIPILNAVVAITILSLQPAVVNDFSTSSRISRGDALVYTSIKRNSWKSGEPWGEKWSVMRRGVQSSHIARQSISVAVAVSPISFTCEGLKLISSTKCVKAIWNSSPLH